MKSGLLLSGEGEGGRGKRTNETEAAILPPPVQYGQASTNCLSLPLVPDEREQGKEEYPVWRKKKNIKLHSGDSKKRLVKQIKLEINS